LATRALVLGGGGPVGIGWEAGMIKGLFDEGVDLSQADLIVGTSAGAIVGSQLASGMHIPELYESHHDRVRQTTDNLAFGPDAAVLEEIDKLWVGGSAMTDGIRQQIGALAATLKSPAEEAWVARLHAALDMSGWPATPLKITAVNIETGERAILDASSAVDIERAVAASCALPGFLPPVTVDGRRYMDGGLWSISSADLAAGHDVAVVLAPSGSKDTEFDRNTLALLEAEVADLRAGGAAVEYDLPDAEAREAIGESRMDPNALVPAAEQGLRQGRALAASLKGVWDRERAPA